MITLQYPQIGQGRKEAVLEHVPGLRLRHYLGTIPGLIGLRTKCHMFRATNRERLRLSHVPNDGEVIVFELAGR